MVRRPGQRRTDLLDTSEWMHRRLVERLRELTPEQRLRMVFDRIDLGRQINQAGERLRERAR